MEDQKPEEQKPKPIPDSDSDPKKQVATPQPAAEEDDKAALESEQTEQQTDEAIKKAQESSKQKQKQSILQRITTRLNIYLLLFVLLIVIALIIVFFVSNRAQQVAEKQDVTTSQELSQEAVDSLSSNESTVGDPKQLLTVESNSVFSGSVLVEGGLDVAGPIKVGGALNLPGITVSGTSSFDEVQANSVSVAGDVNVQGVLTVEQGLTVNGPVSFAEDIAAPSITVDALAINGDVQFTRHIDAGGGTPSMSQGSALGSGGTATISGTDTAGTITANVGSSPNSGTIAIVTYAATFNGNPHVVVSPVNAAAPDIYISNRTSSGFTIRTASALPVGSISFDYVVID